MATKLTIGIAGAGTMGAGIAQVTAQAGHPTILFDLNEQVLAKAKDGLFKTLTVLVSKEKILLIEPFAKNMEGNAINPLKQQLGSDVSYGEIKFVIASLEYLKNKNNE